MHGCELHAHLPAGQIDPLADGAAVESFLHMQPLIDIYIYIITHIIN
jgi:hypothetical protein